MSDALHLVCPHCHAVNRVPGERLSDKPNCGQCHKAMFVGQPVELGAGVFDKHIMRNDIPVLVDFWAPWCGPCKMMAPQFVNAAGILEPNLRLAKVDTQQEQVLASRYGIRSIPTLVLFRNGHELARQSGAMGANEIVRWVRAQR